MERYPDYSFLAISMSTSCSMFVSERLTYFNGVGFQKAIVGSYKGTCRFYNASGQCMFLKVTITVGSYLISSAGPMLNFKQPPLFLSNPRHVFIVLGNKLQLEAHIDVREESKKARGKKITGIHVSMMDSNLFGCLCVLDMFFQLWTGREVIFCQ